jgi:hypothetical protein
VHLINRLEPISFRHNQPIDFDDGEGFLDGPFLHNHWSRLRDDHIRRFVDNKTLRRIEAMVCGRDLGDSQATRDSEIERIVGEETELPLKLQGDVKIVGPE